MGDNFNQLEEHGKKENIKLKSLNNNTVRILEYLEGLGKQWFIKKWFVMNFKTNPFLLYQIFLLPLHHCFHVRHFHFAVLHIIHYLHHLFHTLKLFQKIIQFRNGCS